MIKNKLLKRIIRYSVVVLFLSNLSLSFANSSKIICPRANEISELISMNEYALARDVAERSIATNSHCFDENPEHKILVMNNLAGIYLKNKDYDLSEKIYLEAIEFATNSNGRCSRAVNSLYKQLLNLSRIINSPSKVEKYQVFIKKTSASSCEEKSKKE